MELLDQQLAMWRAAQELGAYAAAVSRRVADAESQGETSSEAVYGARRWLEWITERADRHDPLSKLPRWRGAAAGRERWLVAGPDPVHAAAAFERLSAIDLGCRDADRRGRSGRVGPLSESEKAKLTAFTCRKSCSRARPEALTDGLRGRVGRVLRFELGSHDLDKAACAGRAHSEPYAQCFSRNRLLVSNAMSCILSSCQS